MKTKYLLIIATASLLILFSCHRKTVPSATTVATNGDTVAVKKAPVKRKPKEPVPKVITVNDTMAKKTVDGRYYYDLQGHRYWRNNKDGKYYIFNKAMYNDDAYKPQ